MKPVTGHRADRLLLIGKPQAPKTSWWASAPAADFTATCQKEAERMNGTATTLNIVPAHDPSVTTEALPWTTPNL